MTNIIKGKKSISKEEDCHCGKPLKITDPRRKIIKKVEFKVVPREENTIADRLATSALRKKVSHGDRPDVFYIGEESPSSEG